MGLNVRTAVCRCDLGRLVESRDVTVDAAAEGPVGGLAVTPYLVTDGPLSTN